MIKEDLFVNPILYPCRIINFTSLLSWCGISAHTWLDKHTGKLEQMSPFSPDV